MLGYLLFRNDQIYWLHTCCKHARRLFVYLFLFPDVPFFFFKAPWPVHVTEGMTKSLPYHILARQAIYFSEVQDPPVLWCRTALGEVAVITDDYHLISGRVPDM